MLKCFEGENTSMCEAIRQMVDEGISMGQKQGSVHEKMTIARRLLEHNMPVEQVFILTMLTKQEVEELSRTIKS